MKILSCIIWFLCAASISAGISLLITKKRCKKKVDAYCAKIEKLNNGCSLISCTWEYAIANVIYRKSRKHPYSFNRPEQDEIRTVLVNPNKPKMFFDPIRDKLFIAFFFGVAAVFAIIGELLIILSWEFSFTKLTI